MPDIFDDVATADADRPPQGDIFDQVADLDAAARRIERNALAGRLGSIAPPRPYELQSPQEHAAEEDPEQPPSEVPQPIRRNRRTGEILPERPASGILSVLDPVSGLKRMYRGLAQMAEPAQQIVADAFNPSPAYVRGAQVDAATRGETGPPTPPSETPQNLERLASGANEILGGGFEAGTPLLVASGLLNPLGTLATLSTATGAQKLAEGGARAAGVSQPYAELMGNAGALVGGGLAGHASGIADPASYRATPETRPPTAPGKYETLSERAPGAVPVSPADAWQVSQWLLAQDRPVAARYWGAKALELATDKWRGAFGSEPVPLTYNGKPATLRYSGAHPKHGPQWTLTDDASGQAVYTGDGKQMQAFLALARPAEPPLAAPLLPEEIPDYARFAKAADTEGWFPLGGKPTPPPSAKIARDLRLSEDQVERFFELYLDGSGDEILAANFGAPTSPKQIAGRVAEPVAAPEPDIFDAVDAEFTDVAPPAPGERSLPSAPEPPAPAGLLPPARKPQTKKLFRMGPAETFDPVPERFQMPPAGTAQGLYPGPRALAPEADVPEEGPSEWEQRVADARERLAQSLLGASYAEARPVERIQIDELIREGYGQSAAPPEEEPVEQPKALRPLPLRPPARPRSSGSEGGPPPPIPAPRPPVPPLPVAPAAAAPPVSEAAPEPTPEQAPVPVPPPQPPAAPPIPAPPLAPKEADAYARFRERANEARWWLSGPPTDESVARSLSLTRAQAARFWRRYMAEEGQKLLAAERAKPAASEPQAEAPVPAAPAWASSLNITKKGNAIGFTKEGRTIVGEYLAKSKSWVIRTANSETSVGSLADGYTRRFPTKELAQRYAASILDPAETRRLAWWDVGFLPKAESESPTAAVGTEAEKQSSAREEPSAAAPPTPSEKPIPPRGEPEAPAEPMAAPAKPQWYLDPPRPLQWISDRMRRDTDGALRFYGKIPAQMVRDFEKWAHAYTDGMGPFAKLWEHASAPVEYRSGYSNPNNRTFFVHARDGVYHVNIQGRGDFPIVSAEFTPDAEAKPRGPRRKLVPPLAQALEALERERTRSDADAAAGASGAAEPLAPSTPRSGAAASSTASESLPDGIEARFAPLFHEKLAKAQREAGLDRDEAAVRATMTDLARQLETGQAMAQVGPRAGGITRSVRVEGRGRTRKETAAYTVTFRSAPASRAEEHVSDDPERAIYELTADLHGLGPRGGNWNAARNLAKSGHLLDNATSGFAAAQAAAEALGQPELAHDLYMHAFSGGWTGAAPDLSFAEIAHRYAESLPRNEGALADARRGNDDDPHAKLLGGPKPSKGHRKWEGQMDAYENAAQDLAESLARVRQRIATAKLLNNGATPRIEESERAFDAIERRIAENLAFARDETRAEFAREKEKLEPEVRRFAQAYARYGEAAFPEAGLPSGVHPAEALARYRKITGTEGGWPELLAQMGIAEETPPEPVAVPRSGKDKLVKAELEELDRIAPGVTERVSANNLARFERRGWAEPDGTLTDKGARAAWSLRRERIDAAKGRPIGEYAPGAGELPKLEETRFGFPRNYWNLVDGEVWHTDGRGAWRGDFPPNWEPRDAAKPGPDIAKLMPKTQGAPVAPVGFATWERGRERQTNVVFDNGAALAGDLYDYTNRRYGPVRWTQEPDSAHRHPFQAWDRNGRRVALVMGMQAAEVPENLRPLVKALPEVPPFAPLFSRSEPVPGFYSQLERAIEQKMPARASARQLEAILRNPQNGVKADELASTGFDDWLAARKGSVSKEEALDFARERAVRVEEIVKGRVADPERVAQARAAYEDAHRRYREAVAKGEAASGFREGDRVATVGSAPSRGGYSYSTGKIYEARRGADGALRWQHVEDFGGVRSGRSDRFVRELQAEAPYPWVAPVARGEIVRSSEVPYPFALEHEVAMRKRDLDRALAGEGDPVHYEKFTLPSRATRGNYRELLLTLPVEDRAAIARRQAIERRLAEIDALPEAEWQRRGGAIEDERQGLLSAYDDLRGSPAPTLFSSGHWREPNVVAHVRFDERAGPKGEKILHIEEIQSDWHQAGKRHGYRPRNAPEPTEVEDRMAVPPAPFAKSWHELAFRRVLRWAAERGYDRVTWTTGEQQAARYDLAKHVDHLAYDLPAKILTALKDGKVVVAKNDVSPEALPDFVGKEVAQRLLDASAASGDGIARLGGLDLKVGGEGMKGFYDRILPAYANKYAKKWGASVRDAKIQTGNNRATTVHSLDIPPAMRESVLREGQPLFVEYPGATEPRGGGEPAREARAERTEAGELLTDTTGIRAIGALWNVANPAGVALSPSHAIHAAERLRAAGHRALADALERGARDASGGKLLVVNGDLPPERLAQVFAHERAHSAQTALPQHLGSQLEAFFAHPLALKAGEALVRRGYPPHQVALEIGAHLAALEHEKMGLSDAEGEALARHYVSSLAREHGERVREAFRDLAPVLERFVDEGRADQAKPGADAGSPEKGTEGVSRGVPEDARGEAREEPGEADPSFSPPFEREDVTPRSAERGAAPMLGALAQWIANRFRADGPRVNYSGLGALSDKFNRNLSQLEKASPSAFAAALRAASSRAQSATVLRAAIPAILDALKGGEFTWPEVRLALIESRLRGLRERWEDFARQAEAMSGPEAIAAWRDHLSGLLDAIEGKRGLPQDLAQTAAALAERGDGETLGAFLAQAFRDAAASVHRAMDPDWFDAVSADPKVRAALGIYQRLVETPMSDNHALNEGVFSDALGPLDTYYPLIPVDREPSSGGPGRRAPYQKPRNIANAFATGLADGYDATMDALRERLGRAVRANDKAALLRTLEDEGLLRALPPGARADEATYFYRGREYAAERVEIAPARTILRDGRATHLPARTGLTPAWLARELRPILERERMSAPTAVERILNAVNTYALAGPADFVFHTANLFGTLVANTPFLENSPGGKLLSAPLLKKFTAIGKVLAIDPTTPEAAADLVEMAKLGLVPDRYASVTFSERAAEELGAERKRFSLSPALYGPKGVDIRARLVMYRLAKAVNPEATPRELYHFVNQLGNYVPALQSEVERAFKASGFSPFFTAGSTMSRNGIHAWTGSGPMPKSGPSLRVWQQLTGGAFALLALWAVAQRQLTGEWPWEDKKSKLLQLRVPPAARRSRLGVQLWGNGPEEGYLNFGFFDPLVLRGARVLGLPGAYETRQLRGSPGQMIEAAQRDSANALLHPVLGPPPRGLFVGITGVEPYLTGLRDRSGNVAPQFYPAIPPRTAPGLPSIGARALAAAKETNAFYGSLGEATGILGEDKGKKGNHYLRMVLDLALPGLVANASNPDKREAALAAQRRRTGTR